MKNGFNTTNQAQSLVFETKDAKLPYERIDLLTYLASLVFLISAQETAILTKTMLDFF